MIVTLKFDQKAYSGKMDGLIYYWHPRFNKLLARRLPEKTKPTAAKQRFAQVSKNLRALQPSAAFQSDLLAYLQMLQADDYFPNLNSWYLLFTKLMFAFGDRHPEIDIGILTKQEIIGNDYSCRSVITAVEDLLLPRVKGFETLVAVIWGSDEVMESGSW